MAGRLQALAPLYFEHLLIARALLEIGVATVLPSVRVVAELTIALRSQATWPSAPRKRGPHNTVVTLASIAAELANCWVH